MKKAIAVAGIAILAFVGVGHPADAAVTKFANCTKMHAKYKGGVAKVGAKDKRASGKARYAPYRSTALYNANKSMDRDKDGVACER